MIGAPDLGELEKLVRQWLDLRKELSQVRNDWDRQEDLLQDELGMLERQKERLSGIVAAKKVTIRSLEIELNEAEKARNAHNSKLDKLKPCLLEAEKHLASWEQTLPFFLRRSLIETFRKIRIDGQVENASDLSQRLQSVFSLYNQLEQLNCTIHAEKLIIKDAGGIEREMDALFFGLAFGFAVSPDDTHAAFGRITDRGLEWDWDPALASPVRLAWSCYQKEKAASFVNLPLRIEETLR
jgi:hypothetical protein